MSAAVKGSKFAMVCHCGRAANCRRTIFRGRRSRQPTVLVVAEEPNDRPGGRIPRTRPPSSKIHTHLSRHRGLAPDLHPEDVTNPWIMAGGRPAWSGLSAAVGIVVPGRQTGRVQWISVPTPIGDLGLAADLGEITAVHFGGVGKNAITDQPQPVLIEARAQLEAYFRGELTDFALALGAPSGTDFEKEVWKAIAAIPYGEMTTYGEIASTVGDPRCGPGGRHRVQPQSGAGHRAVPSRRRRRRQAGRLRRRPRPQAVPAATRSHASASSSEFAYDRDQ